MASWLGQRVQITGVLVTPTAPAGASSSATGSTGGTGSAAAATTMPEFRVVTVQPVSGPCPPR
jgi:hypothetical protein